MAILDSSIINHTETIAVLYGEKGRIRMHGRFHEGERITIAVDGKEEEELFIPKTGFGYYHEILAVNDALRNGKTESEKLLINFNYFETIWIKGFF